MAFNPLYISINADSIPKDQGFDNVLLLTDFAVLRQSLTQQALQETSAIVIIASCPDVTEMGLLLRLAEYLRDHQHDAPPVILLPQIDRSADKASRTAWILRLIEDCIIDDVIYGSPTGPALTLNIQAKTKRLDTYLVRYHAERTRRLVVAEQRMRLMQSIDFVHWQYLRARIFQAIPPMRSDIGDGRSIAGWRIMDKVNTGVFGIVYKAQSNVRMGQDNDMTLTAAMLVIDKVKDVQGLYDMRVLNRFLQVMHSLDFDRHPNLARMLGVYHSSRHLYVNTEICSSTTLFARLKKRDFAVEGVADLISARGIHSIIGQACSAIRHLHLVKHVCHRDLKPENFTVQELPDGTFDLKLGGFELAMILQPGQLCMSACGTMPFAAPEIILAKTAGYCGLAADMWSLGILLLEVINGVRTLEGLVRRKHEKKKSARPSTVAAKRIQEAFADGTYTESLFADCSSEMRDSYLPLVKGLAQVSVSDRMTASGLSNEQLVQLSPHA